MPRTARRTSGSNPDASRGAHLNQEPDSELKLGIEDRGRIGDARSRRKERAEFPPQRVREAGTTGGELPNRAPDRDVTADDMSPDTLLGEARSRTPSDRVETGASARGLREVSAAEVGLGGGTDEAEDAVRDPVGREEARRLARKAAQHARDPNAFEPSEAEVQAAAQRRRR